MVTGTVDQLGSRLLFRGYGVSRSDLPIDAALVGTDALIILDEAHLIEPLRHTLATLQTWEKTVPHPVLPLRPPRLVSMSATVRPRVLQETAGDLLDIDENDLKDKEAGRRLGAEKTAVLWGITGGTKKRARARLAAAMTEAAKRLTDEFDVSTVGVVVNQIRTAREIHEALSGEGRRSELLIGPSREVDRSLILDRVFAEAGIGRGDPSAVSPLFVVATQTIEVGINLDFDALVSEAASLDALTQRLGRVDRLGRRSEQGEPVPVVIVHSEKAHEDDPVYGAALARTWEALTTERTWEEVRGKTGPARASLKGSLNLGPRALRWLTDQLEDPGSLVATAPETPAVLAEDLLQAWVQTSPRPREDTAIEPFLRGRIDVRPEVSLLWRADVQPGEKLAEQATRSLALRPPCTQETVRVPLWHVRRWIQQLDATGLLADLPAVMGAVENDVTAGEGPNLQVARVAEKLDCELLVDPQTLRPGDVLVCPTVIGGLDEYGWAPSAEVRQVVDVADFCESRAGLTVRIQEETLEQFSPAWTMAREWVDARVAEEDLESSTPSFAGSEAQDLARRLRVALTTEDTKRAHGRLLATRVLGPILDDGWAIALVTAPDRNLQSTRRPVLLLRARRASTAPPPAADAMRDPLEGDYRDDVGDTASTSPGQVLLAVHCEAVARRARACAERLGLAEEFARALELAGRLHDLGKADPRFQVWLREGRAYMYAPGDSPLAKSGMDPTDRRAWFGARDDAGWPTGLRHEALSVPLAEQHLGREGIADDQEELILHLVGTHHGYNRPLLPAREGLHAVRIEAEVDGQTYSADAEELEAALIDWRQPGRMRLLVRRHGAWGLALLEAIVRLADMTCSEAGT